MEKRSLILYKLSPSDFRYLWEDCKHCYYQKVRYGITLPTIGMPGVFAKMNSLLQNAIIGMDLRAINSVLPAGKIEVAEGFLRSVPIPPSKNCYISGRFDFVSKLDDGTYSVIDFKITDPSDEKIQKFTQQLHAYKFALENPAEGAPKKVSKMGIIAINPEKIDFPGDTVVFKSSPQWFEIKEDMDSFYKFISEVFELLSGPVPKTNNECAWCKYRLCFNGSENNQDEIPF